MSPAPDPEDPPQSADDRIRAAIGERHVDFVRRFNAADADGIADTFYAADAVLLPPNHAPIVGRAAIRAFLRDFFASAERRCTITLTHVAASGDLAYVVGTYTATVRFPDGSTAGETGNLLEAWRRDRAGAWWCAADMYASDIPQPADQP
jgi:uncharacterized protein (TIGR02246 family)